MVKKKDEMEGAEEISAPCNKMKIAIMMKKFIQTSKFGAQSHYVSMKTWNAGQVVYKTADIQELKELGAPMRMFVEDVD